MNNQEIKEQIKAILNKIDGQIIGAWGESLENTTEAVIIENNENLIYNHWLEDLNNLFNKL